MPNHGMVGIWIVKVMVIIVAVINSSLTVYNRGTMAPNGSEFSQGVWISIFLFYVLALCLRNFTGFYCIVLMYVYLILLRNTRCRNNWKTIAEVISLWFWCKYFTHNSILNSESSKKIYRLPILYLNMTAYPFWVPGVVCHCLGGRKGSVTKHH